MDIKVNGVAYASWGDVPLDLRTAIAGSGIDPSGPPPEEPAESDLDEEDELDRLVRLAEAKAAGTLDPDTDLGPRPVVADAPRGPTFEIGGQSYRSIDELPAEIQPAFRLELLGVAPSGQARVPAALRDASPEPPETSATDRGHGSPVETDPIETETLADRSAQPDEAEDLIAKAPLLSKGSKIAIAVMWLVIVALFIASRMVG